MIDYKYLDLFRQDSVDKQLKIVTDDNSVTITNEDIHSEQFELTESLCSESQLRFGMCEASAVKFRISNVFTSLKNKWITISCTLNGNDNEPFQYGRYKVYSDVPTADRKYRDVVAYDSMYDIINSDVANWYNTVLPNEDSTVSLKQFRTSFLTHFGLEQEQANLINDNMTVAKTITVKGNEETGNVSTIGEKMSGKDVITAICEANGCFGHIGRDGKFHYVFLADHVPGLYPRDDLYPANNLYPRQPSGNGISNSLYTSCTYQDYLTQRISKIQIREKENDIGATYPSQSTSNNTYIIQNNFLLYGKETSELEEIAKKIFSVVDEIDYRPFNAEVLGNPCFEVGDAVRLSTKYEIVESYILKRTLKGVQALKDNYIADGEEQYSENLNSVQSSIMQLKGKSNTLERTIDETKSTIINVQDGLQSQITQNAKEITAEVKRANEAEGELSSKITQTADSITSTVNKQIAETKEYADTQASNAETNAKNDTDEKLKSYSTTTEMNSAIEQTAESITSTVNKQITETKDYANTQATNALSSANGATDEKLKSYSTTTQMNSAINQSANSINLSVNEKITETKTYAKTQASNAETNAKNDTDEKLKSYSTTTEMNSAIDLKADSITSTVAKNTKNYDTTGYVYPIDIYGYGVPSNDIGAHGFIYLDQETGRVYKKIHTMWQFAEQLQSVQESAESKIEQTANSITQTVSETYETKSNAGTQYDTLSSKISQTPHKIDLSVGSSSGKSTGIKITLKDENGNAVDSADGTIVLSGDVIVKSNLTDGTTQISGNNITTGTINCDLLNGGTINGQAISGGTIDGARITASGRTTEGMLWYDTTIEGASITMDVGGVEQTLICAGLIQVENSDTGGEPWKTEIGEGYLKTSEIILTKQLGRRRGIFNGGDSDTKLWFEDSYIEIDNDLFVAHGKGFGGFNPYAAIETGGRIYSEGAICPVVDNAHPCGTSDYKWSQVYATKGSINTSDVNKKHDINDISEIYEKIFFATRPVTYMLNGGDRVHIGAISQEIEESMNEIGMTPEMFSAFCKDVKKHAVETEDGECIEEPLLDENGNFQYEYGLRYGEYIMLNTHMIQKAYKKIEEQQNEIDTLKQQVSFLMQKLNEGGGV